MYKSDFDASWGESNGILKIDFNLHCESNARKHLLIKYNSSGRETRALNMRHELSRGHISKLAGEGIF